jgi:dedicator of cytokinesis protein 3
MFALYARHEHHFLSEFFLVKLNHNGVPAGPRPEDLVGRIQTLFTDLTSRDVAEEIYLVCRIFKTGEAKDVLRPGTANGAHPTKEPSRASVLFDMARPSSSSSGGTRVHKSSSSVVRAKGSRVSQLFNRSSDEGNPGLKNAQSVGSLKSNGVGRANSYRKPFGCAVLDLSRILQEHPSTVSSPPEAGTDHVMPIFVSSQDHDFHQLHERIIESKTNKLYVL